LVLAPTGVRGYLPGVPECAVPLACSVTEKGEPCRRVAVPGTHPRRCERHLALASSDPLSKRD
jgi:hypothetical protein